MRNLILSAFPRNMRLPDPFTPNLKVDVLQEISVAPKIIPDFQSLIQPISFKKVIEYLKETNNQFVFKMFNFYTGFGFVFENSITSDIFIRNPDNYATKLP